jgi:hypothetical protein
VKLVKECRQATGVIHYWAPVAYTECDAPAEPELDPEPEPEPEAPSSRPVSGPECPDPKAGT